MQITLQVNGQPRPAVIEDDAPHFWTLREELGLQGMKFACVIGQCGACTVPIDGVATRARVFPVSTAVVQPITTIAGLAATPDARLQQAWVDEQVSPCGYCQSGMLMVAAAPLKAKPSSGTEDIDEAMTNLCRCGAYPRVKRAILRTSGQGPA